MVSVICWVMLVISGLLGVFSLLVKDWVWAVVFLGGSILMGILISDGPWWAKAIVIAIITVFPRCMARRAEKTV